MKVPEAKNVTIEKLAETIDIRIKVWCNIRKRAMLSSKPEVQLRASASIQELQHLRLSLCEEMLDIDDPPPSDMTTEAIIEAIT